MISFSAIFISLLLMLSVMSSFVQKKFFKNFVYLTSIMIFLFGIYSMYIEENGLFYTDPLSKLFIFILIIISPLVLIYSSRYIRKNEKRFFTLMFIFIASMYGFITANNIVLFFIFWELISICSFLLISFNHKDEKAVKSGIKCFVLTQLGAVFILFSLILLSILTSSTNIDQMLIGIGSVQKSFLFMASVFLALGAISKSSIFPFNWLPDAMKAPSPVSALLHSATMVNAGIFILVRFMPLISQFPSVLFMIAIFSIISIFYACFSAMVENDVKKILAFSTITNLSYIFATLMLNSKISEAASLFHLLNHAFFKAGLFLLVGVAIEKSHKTNLNFLKGASEKMGIMKWFFVFLVFAACGIPPTNAFLSKWSIYDAWLNAFPVGTVFIAFGTILTIAYYSKILQIFFQHGKKSKPSLNYIFAILPVTFICLFFGITTFGYSFFVQPIVHPILHFKSNFSLFVIFFTILLGMAFSKKGISIDKTGPFVGGEDVKLSINISEMLMDYKIKLTKLSNILNSDNFYKTIIKILPKIKSFAELEHAFFKRFTIITTFLIFVILLIRMML